MTVNVDLKSKPRKLSQTYLVFPEWFIVYATDDLAKVCKRTCASNFPYFKSIFQFWYAYLKAFQLTRKLPFNGQYHGMLIVIGISFSLEMFLKGIYEKTVGRLTWLLAFQGQTPEDNFLANLIEQYGIFMHTVPWYKFDFKAWLEVLDSLPKPKNIRSLERRLIIRLDLWTKMQYAKLISSGVQTPDELELEAIITTHEGKHELISIPRYQAFDYFVKKSSLRYRNFVEIAGNKKICLSVIVPKEITLPDYAEKLYRLSSLTDGNSERQILEMSVEKLLEFVNLTRHRDEIRIEKIYDY